MQTQTTHRQTDTYTHKVLLTTDQGLKNLFKQLPEDTYIFEKKSPNVKTILQLKEEGIYTCVFCRVL